MKIGTRCSRQSTEPARRLERVRASNTHRDLFRVGDPQQRHVVAADLIPELRKRDRNRKKGAREKKGLQEYQHSGRAGLSE
jgi:hypothetical protein